MQLAEFMATTYKPAPGWYVPLSRFCREFIGQLSLEDSFHWTPSRGISSNCASRCRRSGLTKRSTYLLKC